MGWIKIFSFTEKKENIFSYFPWILSKEKKSKIIYIQKWKKHKTNFIVQIKNIIDRSIASQFTNSNILIYKTQLPKLKKNDYYWNDLLDCKIFNTNDIYLGKVTALNRMIYYDALIVTKKNKIQKDKNTIIPIIEKKIIKKIDITKKIITVQWNEK